MPRLAASALFALVLLLTACGGDDDPGPAPTASAWAGEMCRHLQLATKFRNEALGMDIAKVFDNASATFDQITQRVQKLRPAQGAEEFQSGLLKLNKDMSAYLKDHSSKMKAAVAANDNKAIRAEIDAFTQEWDRGAAALEPVYQRMAADARAALENDPACRE